MVKEYLESLKVAERLAKKQIIPNTTIGEAFRNAK
jgi:hypothetical protein